MGRDCGKCGKTLDIERFTLTGKGYRSRICKPCAVDKSREWRAANPERYKRNKRAGALRNYGLTIQAYEDIRASQNNMCAVCSMPLGGRIVVDHDHSCCPGVKSCGNCIRGLIHHKCNVLLGMADDSVELLLGAIQYLERNSTNEFN